MKSPILFLIFNRPDTTEKVWKSISDAKPPRIYIAADGPRPNRESDSSKCTETRKITENVDWNCEVKRLYRSENLGCGRGVSEAITWFFQNEEMGIIIEDDIEPHPDFFEYCDVMLEKYKNDNSIQLIAGHNTFYNGYKSDFSYYMSSLFHMWGWASWRRVWDTYVFDTQNIEMDKFKEKLFTRNLPNATKKYWMSVFDMMRNHGSDTWDFQLFFNQIMYDRFSIISYKNLTRNIGFTEEATHTTKDNEKESNHKTQSPLPIMHPTKIFFDTKADLIFAKNYGWYRFSFFERLLRICKRFI